MAGFDGFCARQANGGWHGLISPENGHVISTRRVGQILLLYTVVGENFLQAGARRGQDIGLRNKLESGGYMVIFQGLVLREK
jgi:hypothetical protein